jgi:hypothetical protein
MILRRPPMPARTRLSFLLVAAPLLLVALCTPVSAQADGWDLTAAPWAAPAAVRDVATFGPTGLVASGDDGEVAVSRDGGATWSSHVPAGFASTSFGAVAFASAQTGAVASGGVVLVTTDGGNTWRRPVFRGSPPSGQIVDMAMRGSVGYLVGAGAMIYATADGGASWQPETSPAVGDFLAVAIAGDGTAVAGTSAGEVLVRSTGSWAIAETLPDPVTAVAASASPAVGNGYPDLFVSAGPAVLGSDGPVGFAPMSAVPPATAWPGIAWLGLPSGATVLAGPAGAGFWTPGPATWLSSHPGLTDFRQAAAPGDQSAAYLLGPDREIARTLSAGRVGASPTLSTRSSLAGAAVAFSSVVRVAAPGTTEVDGRVPGRDWVKIKSYSWSPQFWNKTVRIRLTPSFTTEYRLRFRYGGAWTTLATSVPVEVRPRIIPQSRRYTLHRGDVYRFSGTITPTLRGERMKLLTDRGGSWRSISRSGAVRIGSDGKWTSRRFGTPKAEMYHLRAYIGRTRAHGEAWSPVVTVVIR